MNNPCNSTIRILLKVYSVDKNDAGGGYRTHIYNL